MQAGFSEGSNQIHKEGKTLCVKLATEDIVHTKIQSLKTYSYKDTIKGKFKGKFQGTVTV